MNVQAADAPPAYRRHPLVCERRGIPYASSRDLAVYFNISHVEMLARIDALSAVPSLAGHFIMTSFTVAEDEIERMRSFDMTRAGFAALSQGFTDERSVRVRACGYRAFDILGQAASQQTSLVLTEASVSETPFQFEGRGVRIIEQDDEVWFVATDVARELGYASAKDLTRTLDADEKGGHTMPTLGGPQETAIISEPGLYRAIIQRRANKKHDASLTAKIARFQRWVFHDILPSIRKSGGYGHPTGEVVAAALSDPATLRTLLADYADRMVALQEDVSGMLPKVAALERIADADGSLCVTDAAKVLQTEPGWLFLYLRTHRWIYRRGAAGSDIAYQDKIRRGWLEHKAIVFRRSDGSEKFVANETCARVGQPIVFHHIWRIEVIVCTGDICRSHHWPADHRFLTIFR